MKKKFFKYVLPCILAFALSGVYAIVDGFFVGRSIGDAGLAAINIAYPLTALIQAIGTGIGMGGAIQFAIEVGRGDEKRQKGYFTYTLFLLAGACIVVTAALLLAATPLLRLFGAEGQLLQLAQDYMQIIVYGAALQILGTGLIPLIRNLGGVVTAMMAMIAGFLTNIVLDYLFVSVLERGMAGAALATIIGQGVTMVICLAFLLRRRAHTSIDAMRSLQKGPAAILASAVSPFGLTFSPNIILIFVNRAALLYGGEDAVAVYAVIAYVTVIVQLLLQGVGDGCQPLLSQYYGQGDRLSAKTILKMAFIFAFSLAAVCMISMFFLREAVPILFGASPAVTAGVSAAMPFFLAGFLFIAFLRVAIAYFYATHKNLVAYLLIYGEPLLLLLLLFLLPPLLQLDGIWLSIPVTQGCLAVLAVFLLKRQQAADMAQRP